MPATSQDYAPRTSDLVGPLLLAAAFLATSVSLAAAYYAPPATGEMGVIFPPWVDEVTAFSTVVAAGGRIVAPSRFSNIVVAYAEDEQFHARVIAEGAWLLTAAAGLCSPLKEAST
jgi:hypothetical protein